jgi:uncharacterized protein YkwD
MRNHAFRLSVLVSLFLLLSCLPLHETQARGIAPSGLNSASELIAAVNALRASNGLTAYNIYPILMKIDQAHADYQASVGSTTHYSADGSRPFQRALAAGYPVAGDLSRGGFFSENIMSGTNLTVSGAVSAWQEDAPHLNTMLSPNLQDVGAGVSTSGGMTYYTLDAGLASGSPVSYTAPVGANIGAPGTAFVSEFMQPVQISSPDETGAIYHEVQFGQTLWTLAITYKTTVEQIKLLNQLSSIDIYGGQKLLIKRVSTPAPSTTETLAFTATYGMPSSTAAGLKLNPLTSTAEPIPPTITQNSGMVLFAIIAAALLAAGLGTWISTRKPF